MTIMLDKIWHQIGIFTMNTRTRPNSILLNVNLFYDLAHANNRARGLHFSPDYTEIFGMKIYKSEDVETFKLFYDEDRV